jgi:hypothetical protein
MDCTNFRRHHAAWREGRRVSLDRAMAEHAASCPSCARYDRALRVGVELLQQAEIEPSPRFMERLERRLAADEPELREADVLN